jgi:hypothetical protein
MEKRVLGHKHANLALCLAFFLVECATSLKSFDAAKNAFVYPYKFAEQKSYTTVFCVLTRKINNVFKTNFV